jgi:hypothetical protein
MYFNYDFKFCMKSKLSFSFYANLTSLVSFAQEIISMVSAKSHGRLAELTITAPREKKISPPTLLLLFTNRWRE